MVIPLATLLIFAVAAILLALTPGPNWLYLLSRTMCQGTRAGFVSLAGTSTGLLVHRLAPTWMRTQRWVLGGAFGVLAAWLALGTKKTVTP